MLSPVLFTGSFEYVGAPPITASPSTMIFPSSDLTPNDPPVLEPDASAVIFPPTSFIELSAHITDSSAPRDVEVA